jgi:hypothetical protein
MRKRWFAVLALIAVFGVGGGTLQATTGGTGATSHTWTGGSTTHVATPTK